jgi:hypothetical protein
MMMRMMREMTLFSLKGWSARHPNSNFGKQRKGK